MPYIQVRVSSPLTKEQIRHLAAEALNGIGLIPGKTAAVTMTEIIPECELYFGSVDGAPCAIADVAANNSPDPADLKAYSAHICKAISQITGIEKNRIYIRHHAYPEWHTGKMFAE